MKCISKCRNLKQILRIAINCRNRLCSSKNGLGVEDFRGRSPLQRFPARSATTMCSITWSRPLKISKWWKAETSRITYNTSSRARNKILWLRRKCPHSNSTPSFKRFIFPIHNICACPLYDVCICLCVSFRRTTMINEKDLVSARKNWTSRSKCHWKIWSSKSVCKCTTAWIF